MFVLPSILEVILELSPPRLFFGYLYTDDLTARQLYRIHIPLLFQQQQKKLRESLERNDLKISFTSIFYRRLPYHWRFFFFVNFTTMYTGAIFLNLPRITLIRWRLRKLFFFGSPFRPFHEYWAAN